MRAPDSLTGRRAPGPEAGKGPPRGAGRRSEVRRTRWGKGREAPGVEEGERTGPSRASRERLCAGRHLPRGGQKEPPSPPWRPKRGAEHSAARGTRGRGRGLGSPSRPVPGPPASRPKGRAHWPASLRAPRPLAGLGEEHAATVAGAQSGGGGPADGPWARRAGGAQRAWRAWGCGRPLGAGCRAQATAGLEPPRPRPPAPAAAPRAPAPTAPALRAPRPPRPPPAAPSSARTCGLGTRTCGGWCTVGEPSGRRPRVVGCRSSWGARRRGSLGRRRPGGSPGEAPLGRPGSLRGPPTPEAGKQEVCSPAPAAGARGSCSDPGMSGPSSPPRSPARREAAAETPPTPVSRRGRRGAGAEGQSPRAALAGTGSEGLADLGVRSSDFQAPRCRLEVGGAQTWRGRRGESDCSRPEASLRPLRPPLSPSAKRAEEAWSLREGRAGAAW